MATTSENTSGEIQRKNRRNTQSGGESDAKQNRNMITVTQKLLPTKHIRRNKKATIDYKRNAETMHEHKRITKEHKIDQKNIQKRRKKITSNTET